MAEEREWKNGKPGKFQGQKLKSLLVMQYILKHADDEHAVTMEQITAHPAKYGIEAERAHYHLLPRPGGDGIPLR